LKDRHPAVIADVRGQGLMIGIKTHIPNTELAKAAENEDLLLITAGDNVVRLLPPLVIAEAEVSAAIDRIDRACQTLEEEMRQPMKGAAE
jgi:acetylornithine/N-succinyldiaminopimelate aminotransferase